MEADSWAKLRTSLDSGLPLRVVWKSIQNCGEEHITWESIMPILRELHWLPIESWAQFIVWMIPIFTAPWFQLEK